MQTAPPNADAAGPVNMGMANLDQFARTLCELAEADRDLIAVCSDSRGSGKLVEFGKRFPEQLVEVGIAEQNLVGIAAGLASCGKRVFAVSPASFLTARSAEQIKNDVGYSDMPVTLVGISAGVSYGALGSTHHSIHDLALLRAINNLSVVVPADNFETDQAVRAASGSLKPVFLRFGKRPMPHLHASDARFEIGKSIQIRDGDDIAFIATGEAVWRCAFAAQVLADEGVEATVISMHTIKPLDVEAVVSAARRCGQIVTAEEHMIHGGLGEACASTLARHGVQCKFAIAAIADEYTVTGSQTEILSHYGISPEGLAATARKLLS